MLTVWVGALMLIAREEVEWETRLELLLTVVRLLLALVGRFSAVTFFLFYMCFEAALLPTLFLILRWGHQPERLQAATYLLLYTVSAGLPLLVGILAL